MKKIKNFFLGLLSILALSCNSDSEDSTSKAQTKGTIALSVDLGNFFLGGSGTDSPWGHQLQSEITLTFTSSTTVYTQSVTFNPNDPDTFPQLNLPTDSYNWSIQNTGSDITMTSELYLFAESDSPFVVTSGTNTLQIPLQTEFALVTVTSDNVISATLKQGDVTYEMTTQDGYYFGYINATKTDFELSIETNGELFARDYITTPEPYTHYNYNIVFHQTGILGVDILLSETFKIAQGDFVLNADNDADGVPDIEDSCLGTQPGAPVDEFGCGPASPVYLDENGVTVRAYDWALVGTSGVLNGKNYLIVDEPALRAMVSNGEAVTQVCTTKVTDLSELFLNTRFNEDISSWDVSNVTNMAGMFENNTLFNQDIENWDVSNVTDMRSMFNDANSFNQPIGNWNISGVSDLSFMFWRTSFNQPLNNWDVSNVLKMISMFVGTPFNQPIDNWDVSNVTDMSWMFAESEFNQPIGNWDVSQVTDMGAMFLDSSFNQPIGDWNVSNVTKMGFMFSGASSFNQPIGNWDVSRVTNMDAMFQVASSFNQPIENWDVSNVTTMGWMFAYAGEFNQDISGWDVSNVTNMDRLFAYARNFNSNISNWDTSKVTLMNWMFYQATSFNQDLSSWCVTNIPAVPDQFSSFATAWTLPQPVWGTCPN